MKVINVWFEDIHTSSPGGCVNCNLKSLNVYIALCQFYDCSSTAAVTSTSREYHVCSGGAVFLDINNPTIRNCVFVKCIGNGLGSAIYTTTYHERKTCIDCLSDFKCGKESTGYHSVYAFERGTLNIRNINSTNTIAVSRYGSIHLGMYPQSFTFDFISVVFSELTKSVCFGLALTTKQTKSTASHIFIQNTTNTEGIISLYLGNFSVNHLILYECSGKVFKRIDPCDIVFYNCYFWNGIDMTGVITEECTILSTETKAFSNICSIYQSVCTCDSATTKKYSFHIFLYIYIIIS